MVEANGLAKTESKIDRRDEDCEGMTRIRGGSERKYSRSTRFASPQIKSLGPMSVKKRVEIFNSMIWQESRRGEISHANGQ